MRYVKQKLPFLSWPQSSVYLNSELPIRAKTPISKGHYTPEKNMFKTKRTQSPSSIRGSVTQTSISDFFVWCPKDLLSYTIFCSKILKVFTFVKWEEAMTKGETFFQDALLGKLILSKPAWRSWESWVDNLKIIHAFIPMESTLYSPQRQMYPTLNASNLYYLYLFLQPTPCFFHPGHSVLYFIHYWKV